jgi:hypothetical protein
LFVSVPTNGLDKEERRAGKIGNDLGAKLARCEDEVDKRQREEDFFPSLSPPTSGKTEVTREPD